MPYPSGAFPLVLYISNFDLYTIVMNIHTVGNKVNIENRRTLTLYSLDLSYFHSVLAFKNIRQTRCILVIAHSEMTFTSTIYFSLAIKTHRSSGCLLLFQNSNIEASDVSSTPLIVKTADGATIAKTSRPSTGPPLRVGARGKLDS